MVVPKLSTKFCSAIGQSFHFSFYFFSFFTDNDFYNLFLFCIEEKAFEALEN